MNLEIPVSLVLQYTLVFARVAGFLYFVPIPGLRQAASPPKAFLSILLTLALGPTATAYADSAAVLSGAASTWKLATLLLIESGFGLAGGACVSLLLEALPLAAQILGFQAGYSYVNTVDPSSQVDASILNVTYGLFSSLLFFAFNLHLHLIEALADSFEAWPLGVFPFESADIGIFIQLGGAVFVTATRAALPVMSVLLLIDLTLGLLNQVNGRLQLLTLAFPAKIVAGTALSVPLFLVLPELFAGLAETVFGALDALLRR